VKHEIEHDLDVAMARLAARKAVESYKTRFAKYGFESRWVDEDHVEMAFSLQGKRLDGGLVVEPEKLVFTLDVPFIFRVFSGKAVEIIETEARHWIARAKAGDVELTG
jgi:hypothetical protein